MDSFKILIRRTTLFEYEWTVLFDHPTSDHTFAMGGYKWFKRRARAAANAKVKELTDLYRQD